MPRATRPPLAFLLVFGGLCAAYLCMAGMAPGAHAAKRKPKPLSLKLRVPSAGDVTLARSFFDVRVRKGKRLPKRLRFKAGVRNRKKLPRAVDAFFTAVKVKSKKTSKNRARYAALIVVTRRKGTASASQNGEDKDFFARMFWAVAGGGEQGFHIELDRISQEEDNVYQQKRFHLPLCIDTVANFETFPSIESLLDSAASEPVAEVMAKRFSARRNLRYAFAAGCRIKSIPVPTSWFAARGLIKPAPAGGGGGGGGDGPPSTSFTCSGSAGAYSSGALEYYVTTGIACSGGTFTGFELTFSKVPTHAEVFGAPCQVEALGDGSGRGRATCTFSADFPPAAAAGASTYFQNEATCPAASGVELVVFNASGRAGPFSLPRKAGPDCG